MEEIKVHRKFQRFNEENNHETEEMMKKFDEIVFDKVRGSIVTAPKEDSKFKHFNESMINFENFDRLYYISYINHKDANDNQIIYTSFYLIGRMNLNRKHIFIQIKGSLKKDGSLDGGRVFLCVDDNLLKKVILGEHIYNVDTIHQSLDRGGIRTDNIHYEYDDYFLDIKFSNPPFHNLYSLGFKDLKKTLKTRKNILPRYLLNKIDDFVEYYELRARLSF